MDWTPAMTETSDKQRILDCPQRSHIVFAHAYPALSCCCNTFKPCLTLPSSVSLLREPLKTHTGINRTGELDKQKAGPNISLIKSIGWRQIIQYVSLFVIFFLLHFCFISLSNMLSTQLASYSSQFNCVYLLAQSAHPYLHASY